MRLRNLAMTYDVYERHAVVGGLLGERLAGNATESRVLDVGGRVGLLDRFLPAKVVSVNPDGSADVVANGCELPFFDRAFDAVVTIDTLEHLPGTERLAFVEECLRVAGRYVVVAAPFGSEGHSACEEGLERIHRSVLGEPHAYLAEHVRYGLPDSQELEDLTARLEAVTVEAHFAGDYRWQGKQFERAVRAHGSSRLLRLYLHLYNRVSSMALFRPIRLSARPRSTTNRFYLLIERVGTGTVPLPEPASRGVAGAAPV